MEHWLANMLDLYHCDFTQEIAAWRALPPPPPRVFAPKPKKAGRK
jgi:hypothetical protein